MTTFLQKEESTTSQSTFSVRTFAVRLVSISLASTPWTRDREPTSIPWTRDRESTLRQLYIHSHLGSLGISACLHGPFSERRLYSRLSRAWLERGASPAEYNHDEGPKPNLRDNYTSVTPFTAKVSSIYTMKHPQKSPVKLLVYILGFWSRLRINRTYQGSHNQY